MTLFTRNTFLIIGIAAILAGAVLAVAPEGFAFRGPAGGFDAAGGSFAGGGYAGFASAGIAAAGGASSGVYAHETGYLALFGQPLLVAGASALDFGASAVGDSTSRDVAIANGGGVTLLLSSIGPALGGNSLYRVEFPAAPVTIGPGASQTVRIWFRASAGESRDTLEVATNDPFHGTWKLPLTGSGIENGAPVLALSADTLRFGAAPVDSLAERTLSVQNAGTEKLIVGPMTVTGSGFSVSPDSFALDPSGSMDVTVSFTPPGTGAFRETLFVPSNDPALAEPAPVVLEGASPGDLYLLQPPGGSMLFTVVYDAPAPAPRPLLARNAGGDTLRWRSVVSDVAPWLSATPDSGRTAPGDTAAAAVAVDPTGLPTGFYSGTVLLQNRERPIDDLISVTVNLMVQPFTVDVAHDPETALPGEEVKVVAAAGAPVDSGRVYWRRGGEGAFASAAMTPGTGGALEAPIPGSSVGIRGVEYWVAVHGAAGSVRVPDPEIGAPVRVDVWLEKEVAPDLVGGRYRMVSVPLLTGSVSASDALTDDLGAHDPSVWRFGRYDTGAGAYAEHPADLGAPLDAGYGFWLITAEDRKVDVDGFASYPFEEDSSFSIFLEGTGAAGWNQIGHPFAYSVSAAACLVRTDPDHLYTMEEAAQAGLVENAFHDWVYDGDGVGGYEEAVLLEPWRGYFVNNTSGFGLELLVPARESAAPPKKTGPVAGDGEWSARFRAYAGGRAGQEVTVGARRGARPGRDAWDRSSPPRPDASGPDLFLGDGLRADWRAAGGRVERWTIRARHAGDSEVRLRASLPAAPPEGTVLALIDPAAAVTLPVEEGTTYRFVPRPGETERVLEAVCGPAAALAAEGIEARPPEALFRLDAPRPNPFVRGTALRYSLPERGIVSIRIYNLSGRLVRSLMEGTEEAGEHLVDWDGRDGGGRRAAPGIYFVRLTHGGEHTATARLVLFR